MGSGVADDIEIRNPVPEDAAGLWHFVGDSGLEQNTCYTYLLLCSHFGSGSLVAVRSGGIVGCVLGYRPPTHPDTIFVWQIGVRADLRGQGLAGRLLERFVALGFYHECRYLEATIGTGNEASKRLFAEFARKHQADCVSSAGALNYGHNPPHLKAKLLDYIAQRVDATRYQTVRSTLWTNTTNTSCARKPRCEWFASSILRSRARRCMTATAPTRS